ncbi:MAG: hypothetical protein ABEJ56_03160 [Candidatus Nanohaloarchaea archaeon]
MLQSSGSEDAWNYLEERFGVGSHDLANFKLQKISGSYWLHTGTMEIDLKYETRGIRFLRETGRGLKPTTYALQLLGPRISKNIVEIDESELKKLLAREEMIEKEVEEEGYVAIRFEGRIIGCGMYRDGVVSSRIPKGRSEELLEILE